MEWILASLVGYLCGSIPFGLLLTKAAGLGDVRAVGSGNIGATNVLRMGNKKIAALTLVFDALKGTVPVLLAGHFGNPQFAIFAAFAALAGHIFPIWLSFKGGKGVAINIGVLFGLYWPLGLIFLGVWLAFAFLFRISSLSALIASATTPLWAYFFNRHDLILPTAAIAVIIWIMHRANIQRLLAGTESKINLKSPPK